MIKFGQVYFLRHYNYQQTEMATVHPKKTIQNRQVSNSSFKGNSKVSNKQSSVQKTLLTQKYENIPFSSEQSAQIINRRSQEISEKNLISCQNHFLRKTILVLYSFFETMGKSWNLDQLSYKEMLIIMKELRYIKHTEVQIGHQNTQQLKKCYYLWLNMAQGKHISLTNLIIVLCHIQRLDIDLELIEDVVRQLQRGISKFQRQKITNGNPSFIFLVKRQGWEFKGNLLHLSEKHIKQVEKELSSFRYTRWTENDPKVDFNQEEAEQHIPIMSKKSVELASNKRQKILSEIRQKQTVVETIQLHHILNYRQENNKISVSRLETVTEGPKKAAKKTVSSSKKTNMTKPAGKAKAKPVQPKKKTSKSYTNKQNEGVNADKALKTQQLHPYETLEDDPSKLLSEELGLSQITKTQVIQQIDFTDQPEEDNIQMYSQGHNQNKMNKQKQVILPQSLLVPDSDKKRRQYIDIPLLYVDVNIEQGKKQRIVVYEGDTASELAQKFGQKHDLPEQTVERLEVLLQQQIGSVLSKIDQALQEDCSYLY